MENPIKITQKLDKKNYFLCNMYYLKRFLGLREIILLLLLAAAALWLFISFKNIIIFIFLGITLLLIIIAIILFLITGIWGYKHDFESTGISYHTIQFFEDKMVVSSLNKAGEPSFSDEHLYSKIEKIAIKKRKIYIYASVALYYYIIAENIGINEFNTLSAFLTERITADKFKMKKTIRKYPPKKKITLEDK